MLDYERESIDTLFK
ncbi:hypothetical protein CN324_21145 [Bacillus anthracis]|nr:hypothetical protein B2J90_12865 [Bacillus cereus]PED55910.1 hypothetical protein CON50_08320 [Bacillus anthracis]PHA12557.1 hypothetical protein COE65_08910 [Bacillus sp. AFS051223]ATI54092.1 hypothetical protein CPZ32_22085 [Bacillus cereus]OOL09220.1 hypothetical protein BHL37_26335 [Bacillus cereus]